MTKNCRETLTVTALVAAIGGATVAQVLDRPSPQPSPPPVHAYLMPAIHSQGPARVPGPSPKPSPPRS
jgi:hypothetical protein